MNTRFVEIYALVVCLFSLGCFVITLGLAVWDVVEIGAPEFTLQTREYDCHQSDRAYTDCYSKRYEYSRKTNPIPFPVGDELTEQRDREYDQKLRSKRRMALQDLLQKSIILIIDLVVFILHWKLAGKTRREYDQRPPQAFGEVS